MTKKEAIDRLEMVIDILPEDDEAAETIWAVIKGLDNGFDDEIKEGVRE